MKYSFNSFPFASCLSWLPVYTVEETIARLADAGYDAVELGCAAPHTWPEYHPLGWGAGAQLGLL